MNAERLLAHFDRVADAPGAVGRLRRFVLDLAVRGKLVEQDPSDEPASELLKRIAAEKARMVKAGRVRESCKVANGDPVPRFALPASWVWSPIESVAHIEMGQSPRSEHYNRIGNGLAFFQGKADFGPRHPTPRYWCTKPTKVAEPDDILLSVRAPVGPTNVADQRCCIGRGLAALRPLEGLNREFMLFALRAFELDLASLGFGTTFVAITKKQLTRYGFPLPPLAEQRRIVAKVDELMALCDRLEETRASRENTRDRLTQASLTRLSAPDTDEKTYRAHARFAVDALPTLTPRTDQVGLLRQTILSLAVRGKLVRQDQSTAPVGVLLAERGMSMSDSRQFEIPPTWAWVRVGAVSESRLGKMLDRSRNTGTPRRYLRNVNVRWFDFDLSDLLEMRFEDSELPEFALRSGDVLICEGGEPGRAAVWDGREDDIYFQKAIHRVRFSDFVVGQYFVGALRASADDGRLAEYFTGTTIKHFTGTALRTYVFPLPPLAEQRRIVAKVDELMALCDQLEAGLDVVSGAHGRLLNSLLHTSLGFDEAPINGTHDPASRVSA